MHQISVMKDLMRKIASLAIEHDACKVVSAKVKLGALAAPTDSSRKSRRCESSIRRFHPAGILFKTSRRIRPPAPSWMK